MRHTTKKVGSLAFFTVPSGNHCTIPYPKTTPSLNGTKKLPKKYTYFLDEKLSQKFIGEYSQSAWQLKMTLSFLSMTLLL